MRQLTATYVDHFVAATGDASDVTANAGKTAHASLADEDVITTADIIVAAPEAAHYSTLAAATPRLVEPVLSEHWAARTQTGNMRTIRPAP